MPIETDHVDPDEEVMQSPLRPTLRLPCTPSDFETKVFQLIDNEKLSCIEAYLSALEFYDIEVEDAHRVVTITIQDRLRVEYQNRNLMKKVAVFDESTFGQPAPVAVPSIS